MTDELDSAASPTGGDPLAAQIALSQEAGSEAREYLRKQNRIADLTIDTLQKKDKFELSHLRFRRFSDYAKLALEISLGLVVLLIICGLGAMVWSASGSGGLVIEPFSVPPDLAARGLTSEVVAAKLLDQLSQMQAETRSQRAPQSFQNYWGQDIKVMIPDTGVSVGDLNRFLDLKLGHATRVSGEIVRAGAGIAITARTGTDGTGSVSGSESALDPLMHNLAEQVYRLTQPYLYGAWLQAHGRVTDALPVFMALATSGPAREHGWGFLGWSNSLEETEGDRAHYAMLLRGAQADPNLFILRQNIALSEDEMSRPEQAIVDGRKALVLLDTAGNGGIRDSNAPFTRARLQSLIDVDSGDYRPAAALVLHAANSAIFTYSVAALASRSFAGAHDLKSARAAAAMSVQGTDAINLQVKDADDLWAQMFIASQADDTRRVVSLDAKASALLSEKPTVHDLVLVRIVPLVAYAHARLGDLKLANALVGETPDHCDVCLRTRANIAELQRQRARADWWFARAVSENRSVPFAYADWGQALMTRGNLDGAIQKFGEANRKGPHFADPLEMWGEALMAKNRSDLSLEKFEEANQNAPNWGRLHLKWGEALYYTGNKSEAQKQFATAAALDLSASDKSELARKRASRD